MDIAQLWTELQHRFGSGEFNLQPNRKCPETAAVLYTDCQQIAEKLWQLNGSVIWGYSLDVASMPGSQWQRRQVPPPKPSTPFNPRLLTKKSERGTPQWIDKFIELIKDRPPPFVFTMQKMDMNAQEGAVQKEIDEKTGGKVRVKIFPRVGNKQTTAASISTYELETARSILGLDGKVIAHARVIVDISFKKYNRTSGNAPKIQVDQHPCVICLKKADNHHNLPCSHYICQNLLWLKEQALEKGVDYEFICRACNTEIPQELVNASVGWDYASREEKQPDPLPICGICFSEAILEDVLVLSWEHMFHQDWILDNITFLIQEGRIDRGDLACPECAVPHEQLFLSKILPPEIMEQYFRIEYERISIPEHIRVTCGVCDFYFFVPEGTARATCPALSCGKRICLKCCKSHPRKELWESEAAKAEQDLRDLGYKLCPTCANMTFKTKGCNFMRCYSLHCGGRFAFWYLCESSLTEDEEFQHFFDAPYGDVCFNNVKELKQEKKLKEKDEQQMQVYIQTLIDYVNEVVTREVLPDKRGVWEREITTKWLKENEMDYKWAGQLLTDLLALKDFEKDEKTNLDN